MSESGTNTICTSRARLVLVVLIACCGLNGTVHSAENGHGETHSAAHDFHPNMLGIFLGGTFEGREQEFTSGLEYERRINRSFGVGAVVEYVWGDLDFWLIGVPFAYHKGPLKLYVAPGLVDSDDGTDFLARVGGEYSFEVGKWELSPQLNLDFVDGEESWVVGVVIGKGF